MLSELSIHEPRTFSALVKIAQQHLPNNPAMKASSTAPASQPFKHALTQHAHANVTTKDKPQRLAMNGLHWTAATLITSMLPSFF